MHNINKLYLHWIHVCQSDLIAHNLKVEKAITHSFTSHEAWARRLLQCALHGSPINYHYSYTGHDFNTYLMISFTNSLPLSDWKILESLKIQETSCTITSPLATLIAHLFIIGHNMSNLDQWSMYIVLRLIRLLTYNSVTVSTDKCGMFYKSIKLPNMHTSFGLPTQ